MKEDFKTTENVNYEAVAALRDKVLSRGSGTLGNDFSNAFNNIQPFAAEAEGGEVALKWRRDKFDN